MRHNTGCFPMLSMVDELPPSVNNTWAKKRYSTSVVVRWGIGVLVLYPFFAQNVCD